MAAEIKKTKEDLQKARMEGAMPKAKKYAPKFNKDTKVGRSKMQFGDFIKRLFKQIKFTNSSG